MKKFLAILFSVVVTLGAITVLGANVNDPYEFDGDVITNPFWWLYTTEAPETQTEPTTVGANWVLVGQNSNNNYYYDKANMTVNEVVSIQQPGWASELGIYFNVSEAITSVTVNGVSQNVASIDGAGAVVYLSALTQDVNEVIVKYGNSTAKVLFKKEALPETEAPTEKPTEAPTEAPTEKPTEAPTVAPTEKPTEAPTEAPTEKPTEKPVTGITIVSQPTDTTVVEGQLATISVIAQGKGLKYQWQMSTDDGATWKNSKTATAKTAQIAFNMKNEYDARQFRCIISDANRNKVTTKVATLYLDTDKSIIITVQPKNTYSKVNQTTFLEVRAKGEGIKYQWQMSTDGGLTWKNSTAASATTRMLGFSMKESYTGRQFRCVVSDVHGETVISDAVVIGVADVNPITIKTQPGTTVAKEGTSVIYIVEAEGVGLTYQWQISTDDGLTWKNSTSSNAKSSVFGFNMKSSYNGRKIRCIITDANGNTVSTRTVTAICK